MARAPMAIVQDALDDYHWAMTTQASHTTQRSPRLQRIVLVGHCGMDATSLKRAASHAAEGVEVTTANDEQSLKSYAGPDSLLLVNRVLDGQFEVDGGIDLIQRLARQSPRPPMMLISNFAESQQQAQAAGALPGFGKSEAHSDQTARMLGRAVSGS